MPVDAVDQAVISQGLIAAAREMGVKLVRSAYSPVVREASDCAAALLDRGGRVVAQAELIPMQLGSLDATFRPCAELFPPEELREGDFYINNDPFHGGQHVPDIFLFSPIFYEETLVGFSASVAHHLDLGGGAPGLNPNASDVHQEGIIIPPSKYNLQHDWNGGPLERLIRANIRVPDQTIGDFNAQFAANSIGAKRVRELCAKFGADTVAAGMRELQDYSERRSRAAIREVPNGTYYGEDALDDDGQGSEPLPIRVKLTIEDDHIDVDFAGSAPQVTVNINNPFASTVSATLACIKSVLTNPVTIKAPFGSILNPRPPAPVRARMLPSYRIFNAVMKALSVAAPERVIATGFDTTEVVCLSHLGEQGYKIYLEIFGGGFGGGIASDGCDAVDCALSNCSNIPVESMDMDYDFFRVADYSLRPDSGGAGRHRGGLGFQRVYDILSDNVLFGTYSDRFRIPPEGLFGGAKGALAETYVLRDGKKIQLASKQSFMLKRGDRLVTLTGGGGGYGDPAERPQALLQSDLAQGLVSDAAAYTSSRTPTAAG